MLLYSWQLEFSGNLMKNVDQEVTQDLRTPALLPPASFGFLDCVTEIAILVSGGAARKRGLHRML